MLVKRRPTFSPAEAEYLAEEHYGLTGKVKELPSERDQNFRLELATSERFVLKIAHPDEVREVLAFQNAALKHLAEHYHHNLYPRLIASRSGEEVLELQTSEAKYLVRLLSYLSGRPCATLERYPHGFLQSVGCLLGEMDAALRTFTHPAMHRHLQWDSRRAPQVIRANLPFISDPGRARLVEQVVTQCEAHIIPKLEELRMSVIHNDVNDYNLLVRDEKVSGIIDFGDMIHSITVCEVANASAYLMLGKEDPLNVATQVLKGYQHAYPLTKTEGNVLYEFILLRLCVSVSIAAKQKQQDPSNQYLSISEAPAWELLECLSRLESASTREQLGSTS